MQDGGVSQTFHGQCFHAQQETVPDLLATAAFSWDTELRRTGKLSCWSVLCLEVIEDRVTLDYRREAREHVLQSSSFGGFVFFRDFFKDRD